MYLILTRRGIKNAEKLADVIYVLPHIWGKMRSLSLSLPLPPLSLLCIGRLITLPPPSLSLLLLLPPLAGEAVNPTRSLEDAEAKTHL